MRQGGHTGAALSRRLPGVPGVQRDPVTDAWPGAGASTSAGADVGADDVSGGHNAARPTQRLRTPLALLAEGYVVTRGISQTSRMVRWCARTSAYRVVGAPERRLARIGANSTILPGVEIGEGALVGAGSVVVHDVPAGAVAAGNPARVIKQVADLTCPPGRLQRPYTWPPYAAPEPFDPGDACDEVPPRFEPPAPRG